MSTRLIRRPAENPIDRIAGRFFCNTRNPRAIQMGQSTFVLVETIAFLAMLIAGPALAAAGLAVVAVLMFLALKSLNRRLLVEIPQANSVTVEDVMGLWWSLPPDLREQARPLMDGTLRAAWLPDRAQHEVERRLNLMRKFHQEATRQAQHTALAALGDDDVVNAAATLAGFRELRGEPEPVVKPNPCAHKSCRCGQSMTVIGMRDSIIRKTR